MKIIDKVRIFKNDIGYSTTLGRKDKNGEWKNMYITVTINEDLPPVENNTDIIVTDGFLTWYPDKNGMPKIKAVITGYQVGDVNVYQNDPDDDRTTFLGGTYARRIWKMEIN